MPYCCPSYIINKDLDKLEIKTADDAFCQFVELKSRFRLGVYSLKNRREKTSKYGEDLHSLSTTKLQDDKNDSFLLQFTTL